MGVSSSRGQQAFAEQQLLGISARSCCPRQLLIQAGEPLLEPRGFCHPHPHCLGTRLMGPYVGFPQAL